MQGKCLGVPSGPVHVGSSGPSVILGQVFLQAGTPQTLGHEAGLGGLCGTAYVLRQALGQACLQPTSCAQARPPGGAGRPGLAPWSPRRPTHGVLLGARGCPWLRPAGHGAAPAACCYAHAALSPLFAIHLALCPIMPVAGPAGLGGDGAEQVVPGAQEVALARQAEAAFSQRHAGGRVAGRPRPVVVLELGQVSRVAVRDELQGRAGSGGLSWAGSRARPPAPLRLACSPGTAAAASWWAGPRCRSAWGTG